MSEKKRELRRSFLAARQAADEAERAAASARLVAHLAAFVLNGKYQKILMFIPHRGEPDLRLLPSALAALAAPGPRFGLPVVGAEPGAMAFHAWQPGDTLVPNRYGIREPDPSKAPALAPDAATIVLVPAVALDRRGYRLGYGGGYYDRFLATHRSLHSLGICFAPQLVDALPDDAHDLPVLWVATESGVLASSRGASASPSRRS